MRPPFSALTPPFPGFFRGDLAKPVAVRDREGRCTCGSRPLAVRLRVRSSQRPQFEGNWHCSRSCLGIAVASTVRRECRLSSSGESRVRHRIPLGLILQMRGVITPEQLRHALAIQEQTGGRIGDVLRRVFQVEERCITEALASQWNAPLWHLPVTPSEDLLRLAPFSIFRAGGSMPLRLIGNKLCLASADGVDSLTALAMERMHGVIVESGIALASSLDACWDASVSVPQRTAEEVLCTDVEEVSRRLTRTIEQVQPVESRAVRVGRRMWLRLWLEPAALAGGPCHREDILDFLFSLPPDRRTEAALPSALARASFTAAS